MTFDGTCERGGVQRAPQEIEERSPAGTGTWYFASGFKLQASSAGARARVALLVSTPHATATAPSTAATASSQGLFSLLSFSRSSFSVQLGYAPCQFLALGALCAPGDWTTPLAGRWELGEGGGLPFSPPALAPVTQHPGTWLLAWLGTGCLVN
jgi:hypothetical protein